MSVLASRSIPLLVPIARLVVAWAIVAATFVLPGRAVAQSTCSTVCMSLGWVTDSLCTSRLAVDDTFYGRSGINEATGHATFDVKTGTIMLETTIRDYLPDLSPIQIGSSISWTDEFQIIGLPPGPPIAFQARLNATGLALNDFDARDHFGVANSEIGLRDASSNSASQIFDGDSVGTTIVLTITASPGQPFLLTVFAHDFAKADSHIASTKAEGALVFGDLPAGAKVTSCGGYLDDAPVPARRSTWGALKLRYR